MSGNYTSIERADYRARIHAYLQTPEWAQRSLKFRTKAGFRCAACGRVSRGNHAHHLTYVRAFTGKEPDRDLMCLCPDCHRKVHTFARRSPLPLDAATRKIVAVIRKDSAPARRTLLGRFRRKRGGKSA